MRWNISFTRAVPAVLALVGPSSACLVGHDAPSPAEPPAAPVRQPGFEWHEWNCGPHAGCTPIRYRVIDSDIDIDIDIDIDGGSRAATGPRWPAAPLYRVAYTRARSPTATDWHNPCGPGGRGLFVAGSWSAGGDYRADGFTFTCLDGAIAKCIRSMGYDPDRWVVNPDGDRLSLRPLHLACVRATRADYCGDGTSYTRDGTAIVVTDALGVNGQPAVPPFAPEACFDRHGAVWIARTRIPVGARIRAGWLELPGCRRPVRPPGGLDPGATVCVASRATPTSWRGDPPGR